MEVLDLNLINPTLQGTDTCSLQSQSDTIFNICLTNTHYVMYIVRTINRIRSLITDDWKKSYEINELYLYLGAVSVHK